MHSYIQGKSGGDEVEETVRLYKSHQRVLGTVA